MHEFYHRGVVIVLMWCHDWPIETKEMDMTDYNSMKADEYAQRLGVEQELEFEIERMAEEVYSELPEWIQADSNRNIGDIITDEAKRRVMQAIKERNEP